MHSQSHFYGNGGADDSMPLMNSSAYPRVPTDASYPESVEINLDGEEDASSSDMSSSNPRRVILRTLPSNYKQRVTLSDHHNRPPCQPEHCPRSLKLCLLFNPFYYRCLLRLCCQVSSAKRLWCINDPCGFTCALFTWLLMAYGEFVVVYVVLGPSPSSIFRWVNGFIFHTFWLLALFSHIKAVFSDPGAIPLGNANVNEIRKMGFVPNQVIYRCPKCDSIKPERAHHCSVCQRCVRKMDHHCPWVNNCVGELNQKYFVLFTLYIFLMSTYGIFISVYFFIGCLASEWDGCSGNRRSESSLWPSPSPAVSTIFILTVICEGAMFGLFTMIMFSSQLYAICRDRTGIEQLKHPQNNTGQRYRSKWQSMEMTFGSPISWRWLSPFHAPFPHLSSSYSGAMNPHDTV